MDWLMLALQVLFWSPMVYRLVRRETPETSFGDELKTSHRVPGIVLYEIGLLLMWIGLGIAFWGGSMDRAVTWRGLSYAVFRPDFVKHALQDDYLNYGRDSVIGRRSRR